MSFITLQGLGLGSVLIIHVNIWRLQVVTFYMDRLTAMLCNTFLFFLGHRNMTGDHLFKVSSISFYCWAIWALKNCFSIKKIIYFPTSHIQFLNFHAPTACNTYLYMKYNHINQYDWKVIVNNLKCKKKLYNKLFYFFYKNYFILNAFTQLGIIFC